MTVVCGCDPGLVNFGFSIVNVKLTGYNILHTHMIENRITDLKDNVLEQQQKLIKEVKYYFKKYKVKLLVIERFLVRGRFGQSIAECVSFMIGSIVYLCRLMKIKVKLVTAASWKNSFQRKLGKPLNDLYKYLKPLPNHIVDSVLQATYGFNPTYENWKSSPLKGLQNEFEVVKNSKRRPAKSN